jgi:replicative DNA helicase
MVTINTIDQINAALGKIPPQAADIEDAVIGALMLEADAYTRIENIISAGAFYKPESNIIFQTVKSLTEKGQAVDLLTVTQSLISTNQIDAAGGFLRVTQLTDKVATAAHIEAHARIIQQKFIQREVIRVSSTIQTMAYDDSIDIDDLLDFMSAQADALADGMQTADNGKTSAQVAKSAIKEIEEDCIKAQSGKLAGINTGFYELNRATGGWRAPNLVILAARPGIGKTSLMLHFILAAAKAGFWVNIYGYEMLSEDLFRIVLSGEADINRSDLRDGRIKESDWQKINRATATLEKLPIIWYDQAEIKSGRIKSITKKNRKAGKCDIVFVDYLQIIPPEDEKVNREQQISKISRTLKSITTICKIPLMALAQLNREIENKPEGTRPVLANLRESGSLEQDADMVIFPYRNADSQFILTIAKHRRGRKGDIEIQANEEMTRFWDETNNPYDAPPESIKPDKITAYTDFYTAEKQTEKAPF